MPPPVPPPEPSAVTADTGAPFADATRESDTTARMAPCSLAGSEHPVHPFRDPGVGTRHVLKMQEKNAGTLCRRARREARSRFSPPRRAGASSPAAPADRRPSPALSGSLIIGGRSLIPPPARPPCARCRENLPTSSSARKTCPARHRRMGSGSSRTSSSPRSSSPAAPTARASACSVGPRAMSGRRPCDPRATGRPSCRRVRTRSPAGAWSSFRPTTSARTSSAWSEPSLGTSTPTCSSSTTARPTAPERSPMSWRRRAPA